MGSLSIMTAVETVKVLQKTVVVPEHIEYPDGRMTIDSGVLTHRAIVTVNLSVKDVDGKPLVDDKVFETNFKEYPTDALKEVLGVVTVSFAESPKPVIVKP